MKIAVVAYSAPPYSAGGVASAHFNLCRLLQKQGVEAKLFTFGDTDREDTDLVIRRGSPVLFVRLVSKFNSIIFGLLQPGVSAYQIADILKSTIGAWRANREIRSFAPDAIILSDHGAPGLFIDKPRTGKMILVSHHNPARFLERPELTKPSRIDVRLAVWLENKVLKKVDGVVCPSGYMKERFGSTYCFSGPIVVIPNVLDAEFVSSIKSLDLQALAGLEKDSANIYMPSAGSKLKGGLYIPEIIRQICLSTQKEVGFYIPGEVEQPIFRALATMPQNAHINLAGRLSYEENIANLKSCSFGISPSLMENYSMALVEAVYCGVPMLAFDTGGNADIISNGHNGFVFAEGDTKALVAQAVELLEAKQLQSLRQSTHQYVEENLNFEKAAKAYIDLIESL